MLAWMGMRTACTRRQNPAKHALFFASSGSIVKSCFSDCSGCAVSRLEVRALRVVSTELYAADVANNAVQVANAADVANKSADVG
eukprot:6071710-Prorocentrum_lima.AAC.1